MKGKYKTIKWEDVKIGDDDQEYLVFYKKGWRGGSDYKHFLTKEDIQQGYNDRGILYSIFEIERIIKFDEYMTEILKPIFQKKEWE